MIYRKGNQMLRLLIAALFVAFVEHQAIGHEIIVGQSQATGSDTKDASILCCSQSHAKSIRGRVNLMLNDLVSNACGAGVSFVEKIDSAASTLVALRNFIRTSRSINPDLPVRDLIFLLSVKSSIDESNWLPWGKLSGKLVLQYEIDLAYSFSLQYAVDNAIGDDGKLVMADFRQDWAKKIFSALSCLRIPEGYR